MKKFIFALIIISSLFYFGCSQCRTQYKHMKSSAVGLNRTVTLYSNDGKIIKTWSGRFTVENHGGSCSFVDGTKVIIVSGTYVIEEE